jgi:hypothetical protein
VNPIPHVVLIDREGIIRFVRIGAGEDTAKEIEAQIRKHLGLGELVTAAAP